MTRLLLALSTSRYSEDLVSSVISEVETRRKEGKSVTIDVLYIIETEELKRISDRVGNEAFLGASIQQEVLDALGAQHHQMALMRIEQVREAAAAIHCAVEVTEQQGAFGDCVIAYASTHECAAIFLTRDDRPFISRFLFGSEADRVARLARKSGLGPVIIDNK